MALDWLIWPMVAWMLDRAQLKISAFNYGAPYNGVGCVDNVNQRRALAPMAYRTLVPWLIWLVERIPGSRRVRVSAVYEPLKIALIALALAVTARAAGVLAALLLAALLPATFYFDYWDWAAELLGLACGLTGDPGLALMGGLVAGLSRETAPLVSLTYVLVTGDVGRGCQILAATLAVMLIVRLWAGRRPLYCQRVMLAMNWRDLKNIASNRPVYLGEISMTVLVSALTLAAVVSGRAGPAWPVPLIIMALGWVMARATETRVFVGCLLWVAMAGAGGIR